MAPSDPARWTLPRLRIDRDGVWYHEDEEVTHTGILGNLASALDVEDGRHFLQLGPVRIPVEVADTPFVVIRVERAPGGLRATLSDLSQEPLDPTTLRLAAGDVPYCRVKGGRFEARLSRAAAYQLLRDATLHESGRATLRVGDARYPLERRAAP
jgi:uncharacterized protein